MLTIRKEEPRDYETVERMTRDAFYNLYIPVCVEGDKFPAAMLVRELKPGALDGRRWYYRDSPAMAVLPEDARAYDDTLPPKERRHTPEQEIFYIMSHSFVE